MKFFIKPLYFDLINLAFINLIFFLFYTEATGGLLILRASIGTPIVLLSFYFESQSCSVLDNPQCHPKEVKKLVTSGIYSKMRHPVYLGRMLMNLGFLIIFPILPMLAIAIVFVIVWYIMALYEEMYLSKKFSRNYKRYKEKVPMFIPKK